MDRNKLLQFWQKKRKKIVRHIENCKQARKHVNLQLYLLTYARTENLSILQLFHPSAVRLSMFVVLVIEVKNQILSTSHALAVMSLR